MNLKMKKGNGEKKKYNIKPIYNKLQGPHQVQESL